MRYAVGLVTDDMFECFTQVLLVEADSHDQALELAHEQGLPDLKYGIYAIEPYHPDEFYFFVGSDKNAPISVQMYMQGTTLPQAIERLLAQGRTIEEMISRHGCCLGPWYLRPNRRMKTPPGLQRAS